MVAQRRRAGHQPGPGGPLRRRGRPAGPLRRRRRRVPPRRRQRHQGPAQHPAGRHRPAGLRDRRRCPTRSSWCTCRRTWTGRVRLLHPARPRGRHPAVREDRLPRRPREDQRRDVVRQRGRRDGKHDVRAGLRACWPRRSASSPASRRFDAGAIVNFSGFKKIVDAMGGVTMTIDQDVKSEHLQPDGKPRPKLASCANNQCAHPYYGPAGEYKKGTYHLRAGRRSTTSASGTACRTATTTGSATSSSSSRRWPSRR